MAGFGEQRREARLNADYTGVPILSDDMYNLCLGGTVLYGLGMSALLCVLMRPFTDTLAANFTLLTVAYFVLVIIGCLMSGFSDNPVISFIGYNMVVLPVGVVLSIAVDSVFEMDSSIVMQALVYTCIVTVCMVILSCLNPGFFLGLGGLLFSVLLGVLISGVVCRLLGWSTMWQAWLCVGLFSLYIGYDFQRAQTFEKTLDNAVDCAMDIYLDIINLFLQILRILAASKSSSSRRGR